MQKKLLIIFLLIVLISFSYYLAKDLFPSKDKQLAKYQKCGKNSDCVIIKGQSCGCCCGGLNTAINKNFKQEWINKLEREPYLCNPTVSDHWSCKNQIQAVCRLNRCVLQTNSLSLFAEKVLTKVRSTYYSFKYPNL